MAGERKAEALQSDAFDRIRVLDREQIQRFLATFHHVERFEAYPDLFAKEEKGEGVIYTYDTREGKYMKSPTRVFRNYLRVMFLTPNKQLCFSLKDVDVIENGVVKSMRLHLIDMKENRRLPPPNVVHLKERKQIFFFKPKTGEKTGVYVFSESGFPLDSSEIDRIVHRAREFRGNLAVTVPKQGGHPDERNLRIYASSSSGKLVMVHEHIDTHAIVALAGGRYALIGERYMGSIRLFDWDDFEILSMPLHGRDAVNLTETRFAVDNRSDVRIFDLAGRDLVPLQEIGMLNRHIIYPLERAADDMLLAADGVWKLESPDQLVKIQTPFPFPLIERYSLSVGFVPTAQKKRMKDVLMLTMSRHSWSCP